MSIILDALKKAEKNRQNPEKRTQVVFNPAPIPPRQKKRLPLIPLTLLVFALLLYIRFPMIKSLITRTAEKTKVMARHTFPQIPHDPEALKNEALKLFDDGQFEESKKKWEDLEKISPEDPEAANNLGVVLKKLGESDQAKNAYEKALKLNPAYPQALNNMGVLIMGNDPKGAILDFNKALLTDPRYAEPYFHLALLLEKEGQAADAASQYRRFLDLSPDVDRKLKGQIEMRILKLKTAAME